MGLPVYFYIILLSLHYFPCPTHTLYLQGTGSSHVRYPKWNGCGNASLYLEFRTTQQDGLLLYTDDGGKGEFVELSHSMGQVTVVLKIVKEAELHVEISGGRGVNDGGWHKVELRRHGMQTTLSVDGESRARYSFGAEYQQFGGSNIDNNSYVYIGGLPPEANKTLSALSLPSAAFRRRYNGYLRNVIYGNCSCLRVRVRPVDGQGFTREPVESCDVRNKCGKGCVCYSRGEGEGRGVGVSEGGVGELETHCDCQYRHCLAGVVENYVLNMDAAEGDRLVTPSDIIVKIRPLIEGGRGDVFVAGVEGRAVRLGAGRAYLSITGADYRSECFGDLELCTMGYTISLWLKLEDSCSRVSHSFTSVFSPGDDVSDDVIVLTNGAHSRVSHGVSVLYRNPRQLEVRFKRKDGYEWRALTTNIVTDRWYHVTASWLPQKGLALYVDGELMDVDVIQTIQKSDSILSLPTDEFCLGSMCHPPLPNLNLTSSAKPNRQNPSQSEAVCSMLVDEFSFLSKYLDLKKIREIGPLYCHNINLRRTVNSSSLYDGLGPSQWHEDSTSGVTFVPGRSGRAVRLEGPGGFINVGDFSDTCVSDLSVCRHGISVMFWILFERFDNHSLVLSTSSTGIQVYIIDGSLVIRAQMKSQVWTTSWSKVKLMEWYHIEISWSNRRGLTLYVNEQIIINDVNHPINHPIMSQSGYHGNDNHRTRFYLGSGHTEDMDKEKEKESLISMIVELFDVCYGHRDKLIEMNIIQRGRPQVTLLEMDKEMNAVPLQVNSAVSMRAIGNPVSVPGKIKNSTRLSGNQWLDIVETDQRGSCLSNLMLCRHGLTISSWIKFSDFQEGMFYFSSGGNPQCSSDDVTVRMMTSWSADQMLEHQAGSGLSLYYSKGQLVGEFIVAGGGGGGRYWLVGVQAPHTESWIFVELSWSQSGGAELYINNDLKGAQLGAMLLEHGWQSGREFCNTWPQHEIWRTLRVGSLLNSSLPLRDVTPKPGNFLIDETEIWYTSRDRLLASGWIARGNVTHIQIKFDTLEDSRVPHDSLSITLSGRTSLARGKLGNALSMRGGSECVSVIQALGRTCLTDLDLCRNGLTINFLLYVRSLVDNAAFITSPSYKIYYRSGRLHARFQSSRYNTMSVSTASLRLNTWLRVEVTWDMERGVELWVDKEMRDRMRLSEETRLRAESSDYRRYNELYLGTPDCTTRDAAGSRSMTDKAPDMLMDELEFWFSHRDYIKAFALAEDDISGVILDMERVDNDLLYHQTHVVYVRGSPMSVASVNGRGLLLNGLNQYLDAGREVACKTNLVNCPKGLTVRLKVRPESLRDKTYLISSAPLDLFIDQRHLVAAARTADKEWRDSTPLPNPGEWHQIDVSWHPENGLEFYLNGSLVASDASPVTNELDYNEASRFYIGRANTEMRREHYAHAVFDDVEIWEASRDKLVSMGYLDLAKEGELFSQKPPVRRREGGAGEGRNPEGRGPEGRGPEGRGPEGRGPEGRNPEGRGPEGRNPGRGDRNKNKTRRPTAAPATTIFPEWWLGTMRPPTTQGYHLEIPTGRPVRTTPGTSRFLEHDLLPKLPPRFKRQLVFDGKAFLMFNMDEFPQSYRQMNGYEQIYLRLRTDEGNGLLWFSGNEYRHLHLSLKSGVLLLVLTYDDHKSTEKFRIQSSATRLDDDVWHDVYITRKEKHLTVAIDNEEHPRTLQDSFDLIPVLAPLRPLRQRRQAGNTSVEDYKPVRVYLGGTENTYEKTGHLMRNNFRGILDKAIFSGDSLPSDINFLDLPMLKPTPPYLEIYGNVQSLEVDEQNRTINEPGAVTFYPLPLSQQHPFLRLPRWEAVERGSLELYFKTVERDGLLLYNGGPLRYRDYFSLEIYDGSLSVLVDLGDGSHRFPMSHNKRMVNDGQAHFVRIEKNGRSLNLTLDNNSHTQNIVSGETSLNLSTFLFVAAVDNQYRLPWNLWTRNQQFFSGCVWGMKFNDGDMVDLAGLTLSQPVPGVEAGCKTKPLECAHAPCINGKCVDVWDGYRCNCAGTAYTGKLCHKHAPMMAFLGQELLEVRLDPMKNTHTDDVTVRFKTQNKNGLLFSTSNQGASDYLRAFIDNGNAKLETNFGGQTKSFQMTLRCDRSLNDDRWHILYVQRRANYLGGWVDNCPPLTADSPGEGYTLDIDKIHVARFDLSHAPSESFVGHIQNFVFNDLNVIELASLNSSSLPPGVTILSSGELTQDERPIPWNAITLRKQSQDAFLAFPSLSTLSPGNLSVSFMFKTEEESGLLLYNRGARPDFLSLEITAGSLQMSLDDGIGIQTTSLPNKVNNNEWHVVKISQVLNKEKDYHLTLDDQFTAKLHIPFSSNVLELTDSFYLGGIPRDMAGIPPPGISSTQHFAGCLSSLSVGENLFNLTSDWRHSASLIVAGCMDATGHCSLSRCKHKGVCRELLNSFECDCNMTAHVGPTCTKGYRFGTVNSTGMAEVLLPRAEDSFSDRIAFGFMTWQSDAVLVRFESGIGVDYIEFKLKSGVLQVNYDVGYGQMINQESSQLYNDSLYHVVTFTRTGHNTTLTVDSHEPQPYLVPTHAEDSKLEFNEMSLVRVGGSEGAEGNIVEHFNGIIAGVFVNGYRPLDLLYSSTGETRGDIVVASHPFKLPTPVMQDYGPVTPYIPSEALDQKDLDEADARRDPEAERLAALLYQRANPPPQYGGGGIAWLGVNDDGSDGLSVLVMNPESRGGSGISLDLPQDRNIKLAIAEAALVLGEREWGVVRAGGMAGTLLGLLLLTTSLVWAVYQYKPGLYVSPQEKNKKKQQWLKGKGRPYASVNFEHQDSEGGLFTKKLDAANNLRSMTDKNSVSSQTALTSLNPARKWPPDFTTSITLGSGVAGLASTGNYVHRPVQTQLMYVGLGKGGAWGRGNISDDEADDEDEDVSGTGSRRRKSVYHSLGPEDHQDSGLNYQHVEHADVQTQTSRRRVVKEDFNYSPSVEEGSISTSASLPEPRQGAGLNHDRHVSPNTAQQYASAFREFENGGWYGGEGSSMSYSPDDRDASTNTYQLRNVASYSSYKRNKRSKISGKDSLERQHRLKLPAVDSVLVTTDGKLAVTASRHGPPEVWDLTTGELIRVMMGDFMCCADLHLADCDKLLSGQVLHPSAAVVEDLNVIHSKTLQIWDFDSGEPLDMSTRCLYSASKLLHCSPSHIALGNLEDPNTATVTVWDLLGNEPVLSRSHGVVVGVNDYIQWVCSSPDDQFLMVGIQNSLNDSAMMVVWEVKASSDSGSSGSHGSSSGSERSAAGRSGVVVVTMNADVKVTVATLEEEAITGTRDGHLVVWNLRSGRIVRRLVAPPRSPLLTQPASGGKGWWETCQTAHRGAVTALEVSRSRKYLVSGAEDKQLRVWSLENDTLIHTLQGHDAEISSCTFSADSELLASASSDGVIILWRMTDGCSLSTFYSGVKVITVVIGDSNQSLVALGDHQGSRKLMMLEIVRTVQARNVTNESLEPS